MTTTNKMKGAEWRGMTTTQAREKYNEARQAGYPATHALIVAKALIEWEKAESAGMVRLRAEPEQESYLSSFGEPEAYVDNHGRRVSEEKAKEELIEMLDSRGCWWVVAEWFDGVKWHHADSIGMCAGYHDPLNWRENWYVPGLMRSALERVSERLEERNWASTEGLACFA